MATGQLTHGIPFCSHQNRWDSWLITHVLHVVDMLFMLFIPKYASNVL